MNYTAAGLALIATLAGTQIVQRLAPVVWGMEISAVTLESGKYSGRVAGYKIKDCILIPGTVAGWYRLGGVWRETDFQFVADETPDSTRPSGLEPQDFGIWEWSNLPSNTEAVQISLQHDCGGRLELTTVGPFYFPTDSR